MRNYFALIDDDAAQAIRAFSADAQVTDDGHTHRGHDEILAWLTGPASQYETTSTQLSVDQDGPVTTVVVRLTGSFPGGQVDLRNTFTLGPDGLIDDLVISV
ncbi:MAG: nuclear transport factor 2 family protein [Actinomycetales bacterium]|nr:MAG: nuclear transport factor 2 family protein [Actinomycetales bacterium]